MGAHLRGLCAAVGGGGGSAPPLDFPAVRSLTGEITDKTAVRAQLALSFADGALAKQETPPGWSSR